MIYSKDDPEVSELYMALNEICTCMSEGEIWHRKSANECRRMAVRGWGRWHDAESCGDKRIHDKLDKILMDKLMFTPEIDNKMVERANNYMISNMGEFKSHHKHWVDREESLIMALNIAIRKAGSVDMELYQELCCIIKEVQNEVMRVKMTYARLDMGGWTGQDIGVCSKWIHDYFDKEYDGEDINFNIG